MTQSLTDDGSIIKLVSIPCAHYRSLGEPAALWARVENGKCQHFQEAK